MKLYDNFFHDMMLLSPSLNDSLNLSKYNHLWSDGESIQKNLKKGVFYKNT